MKSETSLRIPAAVAIDGRVKTEFAKSTKTINAYQPFSIWVQPGQRVGLFLNSDAAPGRRKAEVFQITPNERNVVVIVKEKRGLLGEQDKPRLIATKNDSQGIEYDEYEAILSGDTWKKITHRFTTQEALSLIPAGTPASVKDAVLSLYDGRCKGALNIPTANSSVRVEFEKADNPQQNVIGFDMYADGLPRVHPSAWLAVIEAASQAGVHVVRTSSAWRPLKGSIAHRTGLGLDVNYLDAAHLNRQGLTAKDIKDHKHSPFISAKEQELFANKEAADAKALSAAKKLNALKKRIDNLRSDDPRRAALEEELQEAEDQKKDAIRSQASANKDWNREKDLHEPGSVKNFRRYLLHCECVRQVFDPWYMDIDAHDDKEPAPNMQSTSNETLHATHLHITVQTPGLSI